MIRRILDWLDRKELPDPLQVKAERARQSIIMRDQPAYEQSASFKAAADEDIRAFEAAASGRE